MGTKMTKLLREAWLRLPSQRKASSQGMAFFPRPACNSSNIGYRGMTCQRYEDEQKMSLPSRNLHSVVQPKVSQGTCSKWSASK